MRKKKEVWRINLKELILGTPDPLPDPESLRFWPPSTESLSERDLLVSTRVEAIAIRFFLLLGSFFLYLLVLLGTPGEVPPWEDT